MTNNEIMYDYVYQVGGLLGLFLGCSILSMIELVYWCTFRVGRNAGNLA